MMMTGIEYARMCTIKKRANDKLKDQGYMSLNQLWDEFFCPVLDLPERTHTYYGEIFGVTDKYFEQEEDE